jgi:putative addiction module CopG family antidote
MRTTRQLSITLPLAMAEKVRGKVDSGEYSSESEVIRDGLRALLERDAMVEKWLRNEVVQAYDALEENPDDVFSSDEVFGPLKERYEAAKRRGR